MIPPFPLYVDEISPDNIKATVSNKGTIFYNLRTMSLDMPLPFRHDLFNLKYGTFILPVGKFICMLVRDKDSSGMVILDLIGKEELAERMAERLSQVDLQEKFMTAYEEIIHHPEKHGRFRWVVGTTENLRY